MKLGLKFSKNKHRQNQKLDENSSLLSKLRHSRLFSFLPFLLLACLIWILQTLQFNVVRPIYIPISTKHISKSQGIQGRVPDVLEIQVQDKGMEHIKYSLMNFDTIQLTSFTEQNGQQYIGILRKDLGEKLSVNLSRTATIKQQSFYELKIPVYQRGAKRVPLTLGGEVLTATGFTIGKLQLRPDSITIYGDTGVLRHIKHISTHSLGDTIIKQSFSKRIGLKLPAGIYSDTTSVKVDIQLEELTEQTYTLPIVVLNQPLEYNIIPMPSTAMVTLTIPRSKYAQITEDILKLVVDYKDSTEETEGLTLKLSQKPSWVIQSRITPDVIQVIKEPNKSTN